MSRRLWLDKRFGQAQSCGHETSHEKIFTFVALLSIFIAGCETNQPTVQAPSSQEVDWANKVIALDAQQKAIQKREQELNQQELQVQQSKVQADLEKKQAEAKAWVAQNKEQIEKELTESNRTNSQNMLESFGFNGVVLDYLVDDVAVEGNILSYSQVFLWKNSDDSGEVARINVGYEIQNDKFVGSNIVGTKHLSVTELAAFMNGSPQQNSDQVSSSAPRDSAPSTWTPPPPNSDDWHHWYKVGGGAALAVGVPLLLHSLFDNGN